MGLCIRSLVSPVRGWFALSRRLREYRLTLGGILNTRYVKEQQTTNSTEVQVSEQDSILSKTFPSLREVEEIIGYSFENRDLLEEAFTHNSYNNKCSYERLEYVGDSILNLLITNEQFTSYPNLQPGLLSHLRSANVDTEKLARAAVSRKLHRYLRYRQPVIRKQIREFIGLLPQYPLQSNGLIDAPKVLADIVESTIGAIFIDSNSSMDITWKVAKDMIQPIITPEVLQVHPVKKLYETCQKNGLKVRMVDLWLKEGAYEVIIDNRIKGRGMCRAKKEIALNRAADDAYHEIVRKLGFKHNTDYGS